MTSWERAKGVLKGWGITEKLFDLQGMQIATSEIAEAIRAAVAEEREACATLSEACYDRNQYCSPGCRCGDGAHIAMAIRARSNA